MNNLQIHLEPRSIAQCSNPDIPSNILNAFPHGMLQHQVDLYTVARSYDITLDLAPTGTGKTNAGLSVIDHNCDRNAIYIAPTNALIEQQAEAAEQFIKTAGLQHIVKAASAKHIRDWDNGRVGKRSGEKLYNVLREPGTLFPECSGRPILLVTNPDIFYYAAFFQYRQLDQVNIAYSFYSSFATIIFDEFHLYDAKQLVSLLFYLAFSKVFRYFEHGRKIVLLTATPEPACQAAFEKLSTQGVKIAIVDGSKSCENLIPSQSEVELELRPQKARDELISEISAEVVQRLQSYPNRYGAVILDSLDQVNRLNDALCDAGYEQLRGRITGAVKSKADRHEAAQKQVILATSTIDVGFNFERDEAWERQSLDWLIFSSRDRFSFWQRIGRVGRVLGKKETDIPSEVIAYLPEKAWEEEILDLDCSGGRYALQQKLETLSCMDRPFLDIYWRSEAFLEIARPLLELENLLQDLPDASLVEELFQVLKIILGGKRDWSDYRGRMKVIKGAENIASMSYRKLQKGWKFVKGGRSLVCSFLKTVCPDDWEDIQSGRASLDDVEDLIKNDSELAEAIQAYAVIYRTSYAPLFGFRDSLFSSLIISDPQGLLLDNAGDTDLDPIHLLRFYEFEIDGDRIEVIARADEPYQLTFTLQVEDLETFRQLNLCRLDAFDNWSIRRSCGGATRPTPSIVEKKLLPGVIVAESGRKIGSIIRLKKQGFESYPITVSDNYETKNYLLFPSLSGILALASAGFALKCPDDEEFYIA